jgi:excisionase family DNA binding protein
VASEKQIQQITPEFIDLRTAAAQFSVGRSTLTYLIDSGQLPAYRAVRKWLVKPEHVRQLLLARAHPKPFSKEDLNAMVERAAEEVVGLSWQEKRRQQLKEYREQAALIHTPRPLKTAQRAEKKQEDA